MSPNGTEQFHNADFTAEGKTISLSAPASASRPRAGRPSRDQQEQRHEELLNVALDIFLERGFEQATMVDIATAVGMSKRTVYARYDDKAALFKAAVHRAIERYTIPSEAIEAVATDNLEETLAAVARLRAANVATPNAIRLQRILAAQSYRFPELAHVAFEEGAGPGIAFLCDLFARHEARGEISVEQPARTAYAFLTLALSGTNRGYITGNSADQNEVEERIAFAVRLLMDGIRQR